MRAAYQDQQAAGLMTLAELSEKLAGLEEARRHAEAGLTALKTSEDRAKAVERNGEALVRSLPKAVPEAIRAVPPGERPTIYQRLDLEVKAAPEGYEVSGVFCTPERSRWSKNRSTRMLGLGFRALLAEGVPDRLEVAEV